MVSNYAKVFERRCASLPYHYVLSASTCLAGKLLHSYLYGILFRRLFQSITAEYSLGRMFLLFLLVYPLGLMPAYAGYTPYEGSPFFLLSDKSFSPEQSAVVRLEMSQSFSQNADEYGGADIVIYQVPQPLAFLKKQKNLHRVEVSANYKGEGLSNTLSYLWNNWYANSRTVWRSLFSTEAKQAVVKTAPELKTPATHGRPAEVRHFSQFNPIKGMKLLQRFRYPIFSAKPIEAPKDLNLAGSSSEFIQPRRGNVMVPLGKLKPGLYLVEAYIGKHRATTLVFVSDTVAITKASSDQMLVWAAQRNTGQPVKDVNVIWTDGTGVLQSGKTNVAGVVSFDRNGPEQTYVLGQDERGGVFVSENFYYDSEIYNTKLYAVTDRPLYRPGDQVFIKVLGREFTSARQSNAVKPSDIVIQTIDPNGIPVSKQTVRIAPENGADTSFRLPENAVAGGYEIVLTYGGNDYTAAFRVAEYQKPHFEISLLQDKKDFKTGEAVTGKLMLTYPDGKPVRNAQVDLSVRAQQLTMVEGELKYSGQFPLKLSNERLTTDDNGVALFSLPEAKEPSRYVMTALATDGAAYRVKTTRELLIERSASTYKIVSQRQFSNPGDTVTFEIKALQAGANGKLVPPTQWEMIRLESQTRTSGPLTNKEQLSLTFSQAGSYSLLLRDDGGNIIAAGSHWVSGKGLIAPVGTIEMVLNKDTFRPGETAEVLMTFPESIDSALLTLERDKVEASALLSSPKTWLNTQRVAPNQWKALIPIEENYGPNITFSVVYVKNGDYVFQNQGLKIEQPKVEIAFQTAKTVYRPGERVDVTVTTQFKGKRQSALVAVGVVDEMIYVLQPEIAPDIFDFFYHPRRNNVQTTASLSFISYDLARAYQAKARKRANQERGVKILERPRREEQDTAFWNGNLVTDKNGIAHFSFIMPDSLTRWRMTGRAITNDGNVGQRISYVRSDKPIYAKWTSPKWLRAGDQPLATLALFNQGQQDENIKLGIIGGGINENRTLSIKPGTSFVPVSLAKLQSDAKLNISIANKSGLVDQLETSIVREPLAWSDKRAAIIPVNTGSNTLSLPPDARNVQLSLVPASSAQFSRVIDELLDYPYGCVEQTASRLIPLAIALQTIPPDATGQYQKLTQMAHTHRQRLVQMAGPEATFGWWGRYTSEDTFLTTYAYFADVYASQSLGVTLPEQHGEKVLTLYSKNGINYPFFERALMLWWMKEMRLPVEPMAVALSDEMESKNRNDKSTSAGSVNSSLILAEGANYDHVRNQMAWVLVTQLINNLPPATMNHSNAAAEQLKRINQPLSNALLMLTKRLPIAQANSVLGRVKTEMPTIDRAMALVWIKSALGNVSRAKLQDIKIDSSWQRLQTTSGQTLYYLSQGAALPKAINLSNVEAGTAAYIRYDSYTAVSHTLSVNIERTLYRLNPTKDSEDVTSFKLSKVNAGEILHTDALYLDEISLTLANGQRPMRLGVVEVALPPGASVESGTWGVRLLKDGSNEAVTINAARHEDTRFGYVLAVEKLDNELTMQHLVRFAQKGRYQLPPARFYRMYDPEAKALENAGKTIATWIVQ